jgi:REP element-mobilizing transposase RayT
MNSRFSAGTLPISEKSAYTVDRLRRKVVVAVVLGERLRFQAGRYRSDRTGTDAGCVEFVELPFRVRASVGGFLRNPLPTSEKSGYTGFGILVSGFGETGIHCWREGAMDKSKIQVFDPKQDYSVAWRRLPHWAQAGTMCFITWRTRDSMPREVVARWLAERDELLRREGIGEAEVRDAARPAAAVEHAARPAAAADFGEIGLHWRKLLERLPVERRLAVLFALTERWDGHLDACHGACVLRQRELANIVGESLRKFAGERYELTDFVVMPNHVHLLAAFRTEEAMLKQCGEWKRYTARRINAAIGGSGSFWQEEPFDHLVRSAEQFEHYRRYIAENGPRAGLRENEYLLYSKV